MVLEEFGFPRDGFVFTPGSPTTGRDRYYEAVFSYIQENRTAGGPFAGCNFWSWGGVAQPAADHVYWQRGDDYTGDPAQEQPGLNSVFAADTSTLADSARYAEAAGRISPDPPGTGTRSALDSAPVSFIPQTGCKIRKKAVI